MRFLFFCVVALEGVFKHFRKKKVEEEREREKRVCG
jgi:hypothetical protein